MVRSTLALSLLALIGTAGCTGHAPQTAHSAQGLSVSLCLSLGTGCCDSNADCSSTATRTETCDMTTHMCEVTSDTSQCNLLDALVTCNDNDLCTLDTCGANGECVHTPTALCCLSDVNCDDGDACTVDTCSIGLTGTAGQCVHTPIPDPLCCNGDDDCVGGVIGACGLATCLDNLVDPYPVCTVVSNLGVSCCDTVSDCPQEACNTVACTGNSCVYTPQAADGVCCALGTDCPVLNVCQVGICTNATCGIAVSVDVGCCSSAADCGGADSCHAVSCVDNQCVTTDTCAAPADGGCVGRDCTYQGVEGAADMAQAIKQTGTQSTAADAGVTYSLTGGGCDMTPTHSANAAAFFVAAALLFVVRRRRA